LPPEVQPSLDQRLSAPPPCALSADLRLKIAVELESLRADLEELGVELCHDEDVMLRCMTRLQHLDEMGQRCHWLAQLMRADNPAAVLPDITLQALGDRLMARQA